MLSENADELAKRYLLEELGIPAEAVKDAGKNLIGIFETLYNIDQRLNNPRPTV
jgi:hypothetical protein